MEKLEDAQSYKQILFKAIEQARISIANPETDLRESAVYNSVEGLVSIIQNHGSSLVKTEVDIAHKKMWELYESKFGTMDCQVGEGLVGEYYEML
ncbi:MAG: hypothetical protein ACTSSH_08575, partial [Candidatus Heimdallarchaeota archaeon]